MKRALSLILILTMSLAILLALGPLALADAPRLINYQGVLKDDTGEYLQGQYDLTFQIYPDSVGGGVFPWLEVHPEVEVNTGLFNVILGRYTPLNDVLFATDERWLGVTVDTDDEIAPRMRLTAVPWAFRALVADSALTVAGAGTVDGDWVVVGDDMYAQPAGNVGIGTTTPDRKLEIQDALAILRLTSADVNGSLIELKGTSNQPGDNDRGKIRFLDNADNIEAQIKYVDRDVAPSAFIFHAGDADRMALTDNGDLGLGTNAPEADLEILAEQPHLRLTSDPDDAPYLELRGASGTVGMGWTYGSLRFQDAAGNVKGEVLCSGSTVYPDGVAIKAGGVVGLNVSNSGRVGVGTQNPSRALTVRGNILVENETTGESVLELGVGLDYAEGFDVAGDSPVAPGTVLVIDPDSPGELTPSAIAYDSRVAGIAAGAQGFGSGVKLGVGQFDCDVALAGRVYCNVDATAAGIEPGDLLTTSSTPGFAMKVTDRQAAYGAILGKAMQRLERGQRGQILVLVTLQ